MNTVFGTKIEQTQKFLENGTRIPVTVIRAMDTTVLEVKSPEKNGYQAVQLGMGSRKKASQTLLGHVKKANLSTAPSLIREVRLSDEATLQVGDSVVLEETLQPGDIVSVTGQSKGKGFAGGVKRYGFGGGPRTHGQSDRERAPGSIGQTTTPGRVYKGKKMAGRMGNEQVTVQNLVVVDIDPATKTVLVKGLVPGILGSTVQLTKTGEVKEKNFVPLLKAEEPQVEEATPVENVLVEEPAQEVAEAAPEVVETPEEVKEEGNDGNN